MEEQQVQQKKHHYLITAEIIFQPKDQEMINAVRVNGVILIDDQNLTAAVLGKAQQIVQVNFHGRMQEESQNLTVVDVVLFGLTYLGHMTQEEFSKPPAGMKVQERKEPSLEVVPTPTPDLDEVARAAAQNDAQ